MTQQPIFPPGQYIVFPDAEQQKRVDERAFEQAWDNGDKVAEMFEERIFGFWQRPQRERYELTYAPNLPVFAVPCALCGKTGQVQIGTQLVPIEPPQTPQKGDEVPVVTPEPVMGPCPHCEGRGWTEPLPESFIVQVAQEAEAAGYVFDQTEFLTPYWLGLFTHNPKETIRMFRDLASFMLSEQKKEEAEAEALIEELTLEEPA